VRWDIEGCGLGFEPREVAYGGIGRAVKDKRCGANCELLCPKSGDGISARRSHSVAAFHGD